MCYQGFIQDFLVGGGGGGGEEEKYGFQMFGLPCPLLVHYAANAILFYHLENSTWHVCMGF